MASLLAQPLDTPEETAPAPVAVTASELLGVVQQGTTLLFANAETTDRTVAAGERVAAALGTRVTIFPRWDALVAQVESDDGHRSQIARVAPVGIDMNKVLESERVIEGLAERRLTLREARAEFTRIAALPPVSLGRFALAAVVGACGLAVVYGAIRPSTFPLIALSAGGGVLLRRALSRVSSNVLLQPFGAALLAGLIGGLAQRYDLGSPQRLIAVCPCMLLVPGPHFLNGLIDLARARVALGCSRIAFALLVMVAICGGLLLGLWLLGGDLPISPPTRSVPLAVDLIAAGLAVSAYASFYSMPWRYLPVPIAIGALAHAIRWFALTLGTSIHAAAFLACLFVGLVATPIASRLRLPFAAMSFAAVVSLMPGVFFFRMAGGLVQLSKLGASADPGLTSAVLAEGATALLILLSMGLGLVLPRLVVGHPGPGAGGPR